MAIATLMNTRAQLASDFLDKQSLALIKTYIESQNNSDGGFKGRDGRSDLYYTLFGLECSEALGVTINWDGLWKFLKPFTQMENLDFVHTICLIRCINKFPDLKQKEDILEKLFINSEKFRIAEKGYKLNLTDKQFSIYALFLSILAHEETNRDFPFDLDQILAIINQTKTTDGGYADQSGLKKGTTTVTAAILIVLSQLGIPVDSHLITWVLNQYSIHGGFKASPLAPIPDLLSTGTAMFALNEIGQDLSVLKDATFDFVESVWHENGGFCGHLFEEEPDTEYTFYGLLSIGILGKL